jgi:two-component system, chemotaxis family, CheB/CheR fusion protein
MGRTPIVPPNFRIVTLCGSAGAVSAYLQILKIVPHDSGMAFVVLTHRRAGSTSLLVEVLSSATKMPVQQIKNHSILLPTRVYVIPSGQDLTTNGLVFRLVPMSNLCGWFDGFDIFLASLANHTKNRAVTIILSGSASDGSAALGDLKDRGGLAFAQSDAKVSGMPASAVATGNVDYFCSAADIGTLVSALRPLSLSSSPYDCDDGLVSGSRQHGQYRRLSAPDWPTRN